MIKNFMIKAECLIHGLFQVTLLSLRNQSRKTMIKAECLNHGFLRWILTSFNIASENSWVKGIALVEEFCNGLEAPPISLQKVHDWEEAPEWRTYEEDFERASDITLDCLWVLQSVLIRDIWTQFWAPYISPKSPGLRQIALLMNHSSRFRLPCDIASESPWLRRSALFMHHWRRFRSSLQYRSGKSMIKAVCLKQAILNGFPTPSDIDLESPWVLRLAFIKYFANYLS